MVAGQQKEAENILRELLRESKTTYVSPYMIGAVYASLGNKDKAFGSLEKAYQERTTAFKWSQIQPVKKTLVYLLRPMPT